MEDAELIPLGEAQRRLRTSKNTVARLVREGALTIYLDPLDRRKKLVRADEVERLRQPTRLPQEGKAAA